MRNMKLIWIKCFFLFNFIRFTLFSTFLKCTKSFLLFVLIILCSDKYKPQIYIFFKRKSNHSYRWFYRHKRKYKRRICSYFWFGNQLNLNKLYRYRIIFCISWETYYNKPSKLYAVSVHTWFYFKEWSLPVKDICQ